jgi:hypothetical protein
MNKKFLPIAITAVIVVAIGGLIAYRSAQQPAATIPAPTASSTPNGTGQYTMTQVATHNNQSSCWTVIDGSVYDLTQWVSLHPGGPEAILSICGIDGSNAFHAQHDHAQEQEDVLATFKIGTLIQ